MDTLRRNIATMPDIEHEEDLALGAKAWVDNHVDPAVFTDQAGWVALFEDALGEVRVATDDARERRDHVETRFWVLVEQALGSVLMHQVGRLGPDGPPETYARFHQALVRWQSPELRIRRAAWC